MGAQRALKVSVPIGVDPSDAHAATAVSVAEQLATFLRDEIARSERPAVNGEVREHAREQVREQVRDEVERSEKRIVQELQACMRAEVAATEERLRKSLRV